VGRREVKKTKPGAAELASESGVFENEPTTVVEGVVRSADYPTSDVDQVPTASTCTTRRETTSAKSQGVPKRA